MIDGVVITPLKQFFDERGKVMRMLREDEPTFSRFGEIYFSCTYPGAVKAWHLHKEMTLNYAVVHGEIKCVLYDDRLGSPTRGQIDEHFMSPQNYYLLTVPPMIWNGWKGIGTCQSIVANCASLPHNPDEINRMPPFDPRIPYDWQIQHR
ncbi:MAG: dTDP-4-dehydrorhamnose 3,5-epimerase [Zetaproteobacteria bacterium CG06_land_8_20_14_3_00_59_53]|nr:MAG: dTDP-4-dehydrorhamnose 3,5-epimerase [Zetaproteobacteria bacterium CG2_30_59_37]PIO89879.1 MAG: dTDP-4-dehydrorhamnose 3,5-epimerase [Zetaproteobacteria bacterium CG23_combo_of_CG06-09_8_20_14_all_59_86]PIQ64244.1 MAG: dTDP-4-dehydrorhamnose 3,5-epimerase [Zetaproteobacteria bacterium CG11_big_fil_rev_8_21_14_0_20_59_439]PIU70410.1 MAG: dTDP-4-dehydrorhamnose 3,5-epimerase [Zetaproteobacteria bacterium CG06_land_8_20_14_3_00_59_53]PIU97466.1 MAG: dTDP-4-dehydrorhamnose 3,5-epimerase [Ze